MGGLGRGNALGRGDARRRSSSASGRRRAEQGSILLDVMVAVFIVMIGFAVFLGGISLAASLSARQNARVQSMIQQRNAHANEHTVLFQKE